MTYLEGLRAADARGGCAAIRLERMHSASMKHCRDASCTARVSACDVGSVMPHSSRTDTAKTAPCHTNGCLGSERLKIRRLQGSGAEQFVGCLCSQRNSKYVFTCHALPLSSREMIPQHHLSLFVRSQRTFSCKGKTEDEFVMTSTVQNSNQPSTAIFSLFRMLSAGWAGCDPRHHFHRKANFIIFILPPLFVCTAGRNDE